MIHKALTQITSYPYITLEKRGNAAIKKALTACKSLGFTRVYIPDEGGWLTYKPYAEKLGFEVIEIKTVNGVIVHFEPLEKSVLLCHSLAGYHTKQRCEILVQKMKDTNGIFIEDCCGMIGNPLFGDIIVCSFGHWKPIDFGRGGFCGTKDEKLFSLLQPDGEVLDDPTLELKILSVKQRLDFLYEKRDEYKKLFSDAICDSYGLVILVPYSTEAEKKNIVCICDANHLEYTLCPRYIRSNLTAVCVEIKRLTE